MKCGRQLINFSDCTLGLRRRQVLVFVKQSLLDKEQRREKPSDSDSSKVAWKSACKFGSKKWKAGNFFSCGQSGYFPCDCLKQKQKQKSSKGHYHAKWSEKQENTDSERNKMFVATVRLKADTHANCGICVASRSVMLERNCLMSNIKAL